MVSNLSNDQNHIDRVPSYLKEGIREGWLLQDIPQYRCDGYQDHFSPREKSSFDMPFKILLCESESSASKGLLILFEKFLYIGLSVGKKRDRRKLGDARHHVAG